MSFYPSQKDPGSEAPGYSRNPRFGIAVARLFRGGDFLSSLKKSTGVPLPRMWFDENNF
jgi:hypothetical protein